MIQTLQGALRVHSGMQAEMFVDYSDCVLLCSRLLDGSDVRACPCGVCLILFCVLLLQGFFEL